jgi:Zn-dependent peptidase ImmA (M78 family)
MIFLAVAFLSLSNYAYIWQTKLGLTDWTVDVVETKLPEPYLGKIFWDKRHATIKVSTGLSEKERERTVVHELLHLAFHDESPDREEEVDKKIEAVTRLLVP